MKKIKPLLLFFLAVLCVGSAIPIQAKNISINKKNFPSKVLRDKMDYYDWDIDGKLDNSELKRIKSITINNKKTTDLTGIRKLPYLKKVKFMNMELKHCEELSNLKKLEKIELVNTKIPTLKLKNAKLTSVIMKNDAKISKLDLTGCKNLLNFECNKNSKLTYINLSACKKLSQINFEENNTLICINISGAENLKKLCGELPENCKFIFPELKSLQKVDLSGKGVFNVDCNKLRWVKEFKFTSATINPIELVKLSNAKSIELFDCVSYTPLVFNGLSKLGSLAVNDCDFGRSIDLTGLTGLRQLVYVKSDLDSINFGNALGIRL